MTTQGQQGPAAPEAEASRLKAEVQALQQEVLRLQRKLGDMHAGDLNVVQRAYRSLCQHVEALEEEAHGMVVDLEEFETQLVPPELVAQELSVAAAVTFGVALVHQTIKALPLHKSAAPLLSKGVWLLGGAFVLARLTGGTLAHVAAMFGRNAGRKRRLLRKLEAVQERITIMAALQQWAEKQAGPSAAAAAAAGQGAEAGPGGGGTGEGQAGGLVAPPRRISPTESSSSAEMVEMPQVEELEAAEEGAARAAAAAAAGEAAARAQGAAGTSGAGGRRGAAPEAGQPQQGARPAAGGGGDPLLSLKAYVELGKK